MSLQSTNLADLRTRTLTGIVLAVVFVGMIWYDHGWPLLMLVSAAGALMVTELFLMTAPGRYVFAVVVAILAAAGIWFGGRSAPEIALPLIVAVFVVGWALSPARWRVVFAIYVVLIALGALSVFWIRDPGLWFCLWPAFVTVAVDVGGYFGGRMIGGAKLWPAVSPNKTWAGTITGWVLAALVGLLMSGLIEVDHSALFYALMSVVIALAAQAGDLAESAVKRRAGVKDASDLLPGHGGLLDRFDGMIMAYLLVNLAWQAGII